MHEMLEIKLSKIPSEETKKVFLLLIKGTITPLQKYSMPLASIFQEDTTAFDDRKKQILSELMFSVHYTDKNNTGFFFIFDSISVKDNTFFYTFTEKYLEKISDEAFANFFKLHGLHLQEHAQSYQVEL
jgi:hypothetical protein